MATFKNTVTIARPAEEVFAFLADFGNIPAWNYAIARTVQTSRGPSGVGATYRQIRTIPRRSEERFEVTDFAPPSRLAVHGQIGPFTASSSYLLKPTADGTRLTNDVELEPSSVLLRPIGPLAPSSTASPRPWSAHDPANGGRFRRHRWSRAASLAWLHMTSTLSPTPGAERSPGHRGGETVLPGPHP